MQVTKTYEGVVALEETTEAREYSFGYNKTINVYPSKVDTINNIVAEFLRSECGVNAYYGRRAGSDYDFLWIYNVPFLLSISGTNRYPVFQQPFGAGGIQSSISAKGSTTQGTTNLFKSDGVTYSFGLVFCGNPNTGFALRFKFIGNTTASTNLVLRFMKGENIINGKDAVIWNFRTVYSSGYTSGSDVDTLLIGGANGIDLDGTTINKGSFSSTAMAYTPLLRTKAIHFTANEGALPLVPLMIGPYRANGVYLRPMGFDLPNAHTLSTEVQAEITIGTRSFLITNSDGVSPQLINMGLIETT